MSDSSELRPSTAAVRFLQQFLDDRDAGATRSLAEYQAMFPEDPDAIAAEYDAVMAPASAAADSALETVAGGDRYRDGEVVARGGMGTVHRVFDAALGRSVAMKFLRSGEAALPRPEVLTRFLHEARITAQLQHPGIVPVFDLGVDEQQRPYYTMPLVAGRNLAEIATAMASGSEWTLPRVVDVLVRVCEAVGHAHDRGIIHRDLKPANVMVGVHGEVYVVDWGVARDSRARDPDAQGESVAALETVAGDVIGTPAYMAPEQAHDARDAVDSRSDVYALGAMLYHLLAQKPPYHGASDSRTIDRVLAGPPEPLTEVASAAPAELVAICERAMARDPDQRYASAGELADDLRAFQEGRVVRAHATGPIAELRTWMRRNRGIALASGFAVLALLGGVAVTLQQKLGADRHAAEAKQALALAFDAAEHLLVDFSDQTLASDPAADPLRRALAQRALEYYERFTTLRTDDPEIAAHVAMSHLRIGLLESKLGNVDRAGEALARSREAWRRLEPLGLTDMQRLWQIKVEVESRVLELQRGENAAAIAGLTEAIAVAAGLLQQHPRSTDLRHTLAAAQHNLALAKLRSGEAEAALGLADEKIEHGHWLVSNEPDSPLALHRLCSALLLRGRVLQQLSRAEEADAALAAGASRLDAALAEAPTNRGLRSLLCEIENLRAFGLLQLERRDEARAAFERAIAGQRELVAANPRVRDNQGNLAGSLCNLGMMTAADGDPESARELLETALVHAQRALAIDPTDRRFRRYRAIIGRELAEVCIALTRPEDAARFVHELVRDQPVGHEWVAGMIFAACATLYDRDTELSAADRERLVTEHGDLAIENLRAAKARGTLQADQLHVAAFDAVRGRAEFRELAEGARR